MGIYIAWLFFGCGAVFFGLFFLTYRHNKTSLAGGGGLWFNGFVACMLMAAVFGAVLLQSPLVEILLVAAAILFIILLFFGAYVLIALLFLNGRAMLRRERHSVANSLTLILGLALLIWIVASTILGNLQLPWWLNALRAGVSAVLAYYLVHIWVFFTSLILCNLARPKKNQQYIIVLGARLVEGAPSPLLARRLDKAIAFYNTQKAKALPPKLVMSGGQGADEALPEAEAMRAYALQKGVPTDHILLETESKNTKENMEFSKKVMNKDAKEESYHCIFATSNYHLLRAGLYARHAGLRIDGIGSKTALYYLPTALLREYIAFLRLHLRRNIILAAVLFLLAALFQTIPQIVSWFS